MGEKRTPPATSTEVLRANALREARQRGAPPVLSQVRTAAPPNTVWPMHEVELEKSHLEQIFENAPEAISIVDRDVRVVRVNHEFTRMFGLTTDETYGRTIESLIVPPDRSAETAWIGDNVRKGNKISMETRRSRTDGSLVDVQVSASPVIVDGQHVATYVSYREITEQKRAEELNSALYAIAARAHSDEDPRDFFAAIHTIVGQLMNARNFYIALYDAETQLLTFPYFVDEFDPPPAPKRLGRGLTEYVIRTGEPLLAIPAVFDKLVSEQEVELIGAPSVDWLGVPLRVSSGCIGALVVQSYSDNVRFGERDRDILKFVSQQLASAIEHKRYEEALRRSEARYRSLILSAAYGIYRCNVEGRFLDVNPALIAMLGYASVEEVLALDARKDVFFNPQELDHLMEDYQRTGSLNGVEVQWKRKEGRVIIVRLSGRTVNGADHPGEELEIIAEDITERRQLEEQFRQAQKMDAVGRLAGGVAHDFNNLLMVINGYTEVLLEELKPDSPLHQKMQSIQQAADRAATLTRQLLAFSRKQLLELKVVDVNTVISDMERLLRPLIGENIALITHLSPEAGRTRADAGQLEQVIMNLVVNAKDAMPDGGKIIVQSAEVTIRPNFREHRFIQPGRYVVLSVSDNGHGMDKETQSRIFEPFFTTKEKGKGTGLGLSTVYGIVKQSGGYVFAQSEVGIGTTFYIYLPKVEDDPEVASPSVALQNEHGGSETVLLVEDEDSVRELVRETLTARGYKVLEASDGESALRAAKDFSGRIDILITDVVMPGIGGRELATRLLPLRPDMGILFLSGYTEDTILHQGALNPGTAFLQKPFTLQHLARKVREVLRERAN
jgi:two-component system cell cycle sensor histidine kinase/response regulator CckA